MRIATIILPSLSALALASAPAAIAAGGGTGVTTTATTPPVSANPTSPPAGPGSGNSGGAGIGQTNSAGPSNPSGTSAPAGTSVHPVVAGSAAKIIHGVAYAPADAPAQVQRTIWAGNSIRFKPYIYGGGHGSFTDSGYDCSGSVSYVLHAARLLKTPMASGGFMTWGSSGLGQWMTVYTNPGHMFIEIAGIRLDTSSAGDPTGHSGSGPRWRPALRNTDGYQARHLGAL